MDASTNDIIGFLRRFAPTEVTRLTERHPAAAAHFRADGLVLGHDEDEALGDAAVAMLGVLEETTTSASADAIRLLRSTRRLEVIGAILSLLASGGVVGAMLGMHSPSTAVVLALVGFFANAVPLVVNWLRGSPTGASVGQALVQLRQFAWEAKTLQGTLARATEKDRGAAIDRVNELARKAYFQLSELGYEPRLRPV